MKREIKVNEVTGRVDEEGKGEELREGLIRGVTKEEKLAQIIRRGGKMNATK